MLYIHEFKLIITKLDISQSGFSPEMCVALQHNIRHLSWIYTIYYNIRTGEINLHSHAVSAESSMLTKQRRFLEEN